MRRFEQRPTERLVLGELLDRRVQLVESGEEVKVLDVSIQQLPARRDWGIDKVFVRKGKGGALRRKGEELLERVGLSHRVKHRPRELSGGELQRAAIARALINGPRVLLADEPTGNLDEDTGRHIITLLHELNRQEGLTIVMVTHNLDLAAGTDRTVRLTAGRVEDAAASALPLLAEQ